MKHELCVAAKASEPKVSILDCRRRGEHTVHGCTILRAAAVFGVISLTLTGVHRKVTLTPNSFDDFGIASQERCDVIRQVQTVHPFGRAGPGVVRGCMRKE
jgi:hypothetical protein